MKTSNTEKPLLARRDWTSEEDVVLMALANWGLSTHSAVSVFIQHLGTRTEGAVNSRYVYVRKFVKAKKDPKFHPYFPASVNLSDFERAYSRLLKEGPAPLLYTRAKEISPDVIEAYLEENKAGASPVYNEPEEVTPDHPLLTEAYLDKIRAEHRGNVEAARDERTLNALAEAISQAIEAGLVDSVTYTKGGIKYTIERTK